MKCKPINVVLSLGYFLLISGCNIEPIGKCFKNDECIDGYLCNKDEQCVKADQVEIEIVSEDPSVGVVGDVFSHTISIRGGLKPYTVLKETGPDWLELSKQDAEGDEVWNLTGTPTEVISDDKVKITVKDNTIGQGQQENKELMLTVVLCSASVQETVCYGNGTCKPDGSCVCDLEYAGAQCEKCKTGFEKNEQDECVQYEYECTGSECGSDARKRECGSEGCKDWIVEDCDTNQLCVATQTSASCSTCDTGCQNDKCTGCVDGPCCDDQKQIKPNTMQCASWTEYQCSSTTACGASAQQRIVKKYCDGATSDCNGEVIPDGWLTNKCDDFSEICVTDGSTSASCDACGQSSFCDKGLCVCSYEQCGDGCCAEFETCNWDGKCEKMGKLLADDGQEGDKFGYSVSISGDYAIVGAWGDDDNGTNSGSAYVFHRTADGWKQDGLKLLAYDGQLDDWFGSSVSISGDYAIVGAYGDDDHGNAAGSAYVFHRTADGWKQDGLKLLADDGQASDYFGLSVSISGDYAIVGAWGDDDHGNAAGAAYIFHRTADGWKQDGLKLLADDGQEDDWFGNSVSISGYYAIVGAHGDDDHGNAAGSAYVFHRTDTGWVKYGDKLLAYDGEEGDLFGWSVSISGDYAIVGAHRDDDDDNGADSGSAYVFHWTATGWERYGDKLLAYDGQASDWFGESVSISGDYAIVGAWKDDDNGAGSGSAYVFHRTATGWVKHGDKLLAYDGQANDRFGFSVSISGDYAIVGADGDDDKGTYSGSAYVFNKEVVTLK